MLLLIIITCIMSSRQCYGIKSVGTVQSLACLPQLMSQMDPHVHTHYHYKYIMYFHYVTAVLLPENFLS